MYIFTTYTTVTLVLWAADESNPSNQQEESLAVGSDEDANIFQNDHIIDTADVVVKNSNLRMPSQENILFITFENYFILIFVI